MMGESMTEPGKGEELHAARRKRFWSTLGLIAIAAVPVGAVIGYGVGRHRIGLSEAWQRIDLLLAGSIVIVGLIAFSFATWRFLQAIDEVELVDNLWGSTASYYVYATLFPAWWALGKSGIVAEPNDWAIYFAALAGGLAIYGMRKWRAR
jgi:hypothetical protein